MGTSTRDQSALVAIPYHHAVQNFEYAEEQFLPVDCSKQYKCRGTYTYKPPALLRKGEPKQNRPQRVHQPCLEQHGLHHECQEVKQGNQPGSKELLPVDIYR